MRSVFLFFCDGRREPSVEVFSTDGGAMLAAWAQVREELRDEPDLLKEVLERADLDAAFALLAERSIYLRIEEHRPRSHTEARQLYLTPAHGEKSAEGSAPGEGDVAS